MAEVRSTSSTGGQKGIKLARFDLIPAQPLKELAEHYGKGARKYADNQWRQGYEYGKSYAAMQRHAIDWLAGKSYDVCSNYDPEDCSFVTAEGEPYIPIAPDTCYNHTGSHQMSCIAWHAFAIQEFEKRFPQHDDRYIVEDSASTFHILATDRDEPLFTYVIPHPLPRKDIS